jgi:uncharacterized DUF497 family protein
VFEWDPSKAASNARKHGIQFADAVAVLEDEQALTVADESDAEQRWVTIGTDALGRMLVVVYTWRNDNIRIMSARGATARESSLYLEER